MGLRCIADLSYVKFIISMIFLLNISTLFSQTTSEPDREPLAEIIYYSNLNGNVENCGCGDPPLGGLDRIISMVKEKKKSNKKVLFVDGGDFCNTYPYPELNRCVLKSYEYYPPDVIAFGDQEFIQGTVFIQGFINSRKPNIIGTNLRIPNIELNAYSVVSVGNRELVFLSYLHPEAFSFIKKGEEINLDQSAFDEQYESWVGKATVVVIFHGPESGLDDFCRRYNGTDLILFAHEQSRIIQSERTPFVIGGGADGEFIIHIVLSENQSGLSVHATQLPVYEEVQPDTMIQEYIRSYKDASK